MPRRSTAISCGTRGPRFGYGKAATHPMAPREIITPGAAVDGNGPWLTDTFEIPVGGAMRLQAFGLRQGDRVCVRQVLMDPAKQATHIDDGCGVSCPTAPTVRSVMPYTYCGKSVCMCDKQAILRLRDAGVYALSFGGPSFKAGTVTVTVQPMAAGDVTDSLLAVQCGVCPEYEARVQVQSCEGATLGFMYGLDDYAPENANIIFARCNGELLGRMLSAPEYGHSIALTRCSGVALGYLAEDAVYCTDQGGGCATTNTGMSGTISYTALP